MDDAQPVPVDVSALIDADWPEWRSALEDIRREYGDEGVRALLRRLQEYSIDQGVTLSDALLNTPYTNTLSPDEQPPYPGDLELEKRIENIIRWNAAAMILRAQDEGAGLGGHIATYASAATAMETAFHHIFSAEGRGDLVLPQPHAAPGIYARAYLEGRLSEQQLRNFRRELGKGGGCLHTLTHARCRNSGRCLMLQWGCRYPCRSTSPVLQNICSTEDSWPPMTRGSGVLLATVKQMSLRCWGPSILRRVSGSIIW